MKSKRTFFNNVGRVANNAKKKSMLRHPSDHYSAFRLSGVENEVSWLSFLALISLETLHVGI